MSCKHENASCTGRFNQIICEKTGKTMAYQLIVRVACADCGRKFQFPGFPVGAGEVEAGVNGDATELRLPMAPLHPTIPVTEHPELN